MICLEDFVDIYHSMIDWDSLWIVYHIHIMSVESRLCRNVFNLSTRRRIYKVYSAFDPRRIVLSPFIRKSVFPAKKSSWCC